MIVTPPTIRPATVDDVPKLRRLFKAKGVKQQLPFVKDVTLLDFIAAHDAGSLRHHVDVWDNGGDIMGCARFLHLLRPVDNMAQTTLHDIAVWPNYHGRGVGRDLMDHMAKAAVTYFGAQPVRLFAKVKRDNPNTDFFKKNGFDIVGQQADALHTARIVTPQNVL
jgi:N-acetylglutamate synthase-like GNAT family acetyltransferase